MGLLERILGARNEVITHSADLDAFLRANGMDTEAGISLRSEADVLRLSPVSAAIRIVSNTVAQAPLKMYAPTSEGTRKQLLNHPIVKLLRRPNPLHTNFRFRKILQTQVLLHGIAVALKVRLPGGRGISNLIPLNRSMFKVKQDEKNPFSIAFEVAVQDSEGKLLKRDYSIDDVFYIVGESLDGLTKNVDPMAVNKNAFGIAVGGERTAASLFKNGLQFSGVFKLPGRLSDEAYKRLQESIRENYQGSANAFNALILEEGMDWTKTGLTADEAQFLETRKFQVIEVARIFGVPPHLLFELDRATFNNIEHQSLEFVKYFIQPWWEEWEQQLAGFLLSQNEFGRGYFFEHDASRLLRGDTAAVTRQEIEHVKWGIRSPNEIRADHDWEPFEGGDEHYPPPNSSNASKEPEGDETDDGQEEPPNEVDDKSQLIPFRSAADE